jgi:hypothetical protein
MNDVARAGRSPKVEVLYIKGCPHWQDPARLARSVDEELGTAGAEVSATLIRTPEQAAELGFTGSPTILVAGRNPFPAPRSGHSPAACSRPPGPAGLPDRDELADGIRAASASPPDPPEA